MFVVKVKTLFIIAFISQKVCLTIQSSCIKDGETISCKNINIDDIYREFFNDDFKNHQRALTSIEVSNSNISTIKSIHRLPQVPNIDKVSIHHSLVQRISDTAFQDFDNLVSIDVSFNLLVDVRFVKGLSKSISTIKLNNNNISFLDVDFADFPNISNVDLSYNKLKSIDFGKIITVSTINFANNQISSLVPNENNFLPNQIHHLNLSSNNFSYYDEHRLSIAPKELDLSGNDLKIVDLTYHKLYLNLARSKVEKFLTKICANVADLTNFSNITQVKLLVSKKLVLRKNKFGTLSKDTLDLKEFMDYSSYYYLDLSDSTIFKIAENYFRSMIFLVVDLSFNYITILKANTFAFSNIHKLNLSHCVIQVLQPSCFGRSSMDELDLSHNRIANLDGVFDHSYIETLDLSFNQIKFLKRDTFANSRNIKSINLSHCLIEKIDPQTFIELTNLGFQDLSFNRIKNLDIEMFGTNVNQVKLQGNSIQTVRSLSFKNLNKILILDLSDLKITSIESKAFVNLSGVQEVYLTHNNISTVEPSWFANLSRLTKLDLSYNPIKLTYGISNIKLKKLILTINGTLEANSISNVHVETLVIKNSNIDVLKTNCFKGLFSLTELYFHSSSINRIEPGALNDLFSLEHLDAQHLFRNNKVLEKNIFNDLNSITILNLSHLDLEEMQDSCFKGLKSLNYLDLSKNKISVLKTDTFVGLGHLESLDISQNQLTTIESNVFQSLRQLKWLNIENNRLQKLPTAIFNSLTSLETLKLQNNKLINLTRGFFDGLGNLAILNLAQNNISIMDVGIFQQLVSLKVLNLSRNSLGSIKPPRNAFEIGIFSNLAKLEILDLSFNSIASLNSKYVLNSLRNLKKLLLNHNGLKSLDFDGLLKKCKKLSYIDISFNTWNCDYLADITEKLFNSSISYEPKIPVFDQDNIDGIYCTDICKFVYCEGSAGSELEIQNIY